jgi:hypothetical protein
LDALHIPFSITFTVKNLPEIFIWLPFQEVFRGIPKEERLWLIGVFLAFISYGEF